MKLKQIAVTISLLLSSHLAQGVTQEILGPDLNPVQPEQGLAATLGVEPDNSFVGLELPPAEAKNIRLKQDYLEVVKLLKSGQYKTAETKIKRLIQDNPEQAEFYNLQAALEVLKKQPELAIKSYQKAIQLAPENLRSHLGVATAFLQEGNLNQAKKYANGALSIDDSSSHAYVLLAAIAIQENQQQEAEKLLLTAQKKARGNSQQEIMLATKLAKLYLIQKQPEKALTVAQEMTKRYPDNSSALALLASAQVINKQTVQAIPTLEKIVRLEPKDVPHRLLLARLLAKQPENKQQVLKLLDEVRAIAPDNARAQAQITIVLTQLKLFPEALQAAKKVKQLAPDTGLAEALEGEIYLAENKQEQALLAFQQSYKIKPNNKVLNVITHIMLAQGKQSDAINFLELALTKNAQNPLAHFLLANIYLQQNNYSKAEKHYQAVLIDQPDNAIVLNNLAWIYHQQDKPEAMLLIKRAYQQAPKSAAIVDTYALIIVKQGDLKKGIKLFEQASKLAPKNDEIQYHLADAYAKNGQTKQALKLLKSIAKSEQNFPEKEAAMRLLKSLE